MEKMRYYSLDKILEYKAQYNVIYGERSNGKTTSVLGFILKKYIDSGYKEQGGYIRRWEVDFKGSQGQNITSGIVSLGWVEQWTKGKYNDIRYYSGKWFLCLRDENGKIIDADETPFMFAFAISLQVHYKSTSYPNIRYILFDEFIEKNGGFYIANEFVEFENLLSTIIRLRDDVTIFMCGNTINKYNPYFSEMGLTNAKNQKQGTIELYNYGESKLKVAVEYCASQAKSKKSNVYFAFDNPQLKMITNGSWELDIYPHLPIRYTPKEVRHIFFIVYEDEIFQCEIVKSQELNSKFMYIHRKTTPIKEDNKELVFDPNPSGKRNYRRKITVYNDIKGQRIYELFKMDKVFYQDNEVGNIIDAYVDWCKQDGII